MDTYEVVVKGRLSPALIRGTGMELSCYQHGSTHLLALEFDQVRLHTFFGLLRDLNIELVSVNELR
ncbi:MAG: hypothetical protein ABSC90_12245 [Acidimicrobiales bacterium]|jgi:hypothetical protein